METAEILHQIERHTGKFALAAVEAAVERREEVTPELLRTLEDAVNRATQLEAEGDLHGPSIRHVSVGAVP
jgi:hypothetical protein